MCGEGKLICAAQLFIFVMVVPILSLSTRLHVKNYNRQMPPLLQECSRVIQEVIALAKLSARDISKAAKLEL